MPSNKINGFLDGYLQKEAIWPFGKKYRLGKEVPSKWNMKSFGFRPSVSSRDPLFKGLSDKQLLALTHEMGKAYERQDSTLFPGNVQRENPVSIAELIPLYRSAKQQGIKIRTTEGRGYSWGYRLPFTNKGRMSLDLTRNTEGRPVITPGVVAHEITHSVDPRKISLSYPLEMEIPAVISERAAALPTNPLKDETWQQKYIRKYWPHLYEMPMEQWPTALREAMQSLRGKRQKPGQEDMPQMYKQWLRSQSGEK